MKFTLKHTYSTPLANDPLGTLLDVAGFLVFRSHTPAGLIRYLVLRAITFFGTNDDPLPDATAARLRAGPPIVRHPPMGAEINEKNVISTSVVGAPRLKLLFGK